MPAVRIPLLLPHCRPPDEPCRLASGQRRHIGSFGRGTALLAAGAAAGGPDEGCAGAACAIEGCAGAGCATECDSDSVGALDMIGGALAAVSRPL